MSFHRPERRLRLDDHGAAAVEFALVMPILLLLVCGIADFGRAWHMQVALTHGAREGVRELALSGTQEAARTRTRNAAAPYSDGATEVTPTPCPNALNDARVVARRTYNYITPIGGVIRLINPSRSFTAPVITGTGVMRCGG